jgi:hypothetical protein
MTLRRAPWRALLIALPAILSALPLPVEAAAPARRIPKSATLPADQIREGMTGVGYSVFQGTSVDSFSVTVLGVLRGYRPGASLIMARAKSPVLDQTGIQAGMSGSPVYIGGKLVGAVAYTWAFLKEPLAGITPIEEMLDVLPGDGESPPLREDRFGSLGVPPPMPAEPAGARPIATPLALSGFTPEALRYLEPWLTERGFVAIPGGGTATGGSCDSIGPGSALGVALIRGDLSAAAIGTVTYRDGDRLLAFGHPFLSMGWVEFPLTAATIHMIMPSQQISNKIGSPTVTCGTLLADRSAGVAGRLGSAPEMIPVSVSIQGTGGRSKRYRFEVARSRYVTPALVSAGVVNSISEALFDAGVTTVRWDLTYFMNAGARTIRAGDLFVATSPLSGVGEAITQSLTLLLGDRFRPSRLDSASVSVAVEEGIEEAALTGVRLSHATAAPGDSVEVELSLRRSSKTIETRRVRIQVPPETPEGELTVRVCDADETERWEMGRAPDRYRPETFDQLARLIEDGRRSDRLYVQLYRVAGGATVGSGEISQAPASVLQVLGASRKAGETAATKGATVAERELPMGRIVRGCESASVTVVADRRR